MIDRERIKQHWDDNKKIYIAAVGGIAVGALAVYLLKSKQTIILNQVMPQINPVFNNTVNNGGHVRKIVKCLETGQLWESVTKAAEANDTTLSYMSRHLNGWKPDVHGQHYVIEALASG